MGKKFSRRQFLKSAAITGVGVYGAAALPLDVMAASDAQKSKVVVVASPSVLVDPETNKNTQAKWGIGQSDKSIETRIASEMLLAGVRAFTGAGSDAAAWKKLFKPSDVVGIKVNCLFAKGASTHPEVVSCIIGGLKLAGVKDENIIIWDRNDRELTRAGYVINRGAGIKCYGTEDEYEAEPTKIGSFSGRLSKILTEKITALVNVPILKDHNMCGITCAMKNHYGSHHNPGDHHRNGCDPFLAELNSIPAIREKTRLIVCDALKPLAHGGPGAKPEFVWEYRSLLIGADPVALDYQGSRIIEARRREIGLPLLAESGRPPKFIATAASMGLGTNDPARIEIIRKTV